MNYPLYHAELCPDLWDKSEGEKYVLKSEVRDTLYKIASDFVTEYLREASVTLTVKDVILVGSSANYNWNQFSDIDLHVLVDYAELKMSADDANTLVTAIKINWNKTHDISIKGHDVELYVQGTEQPLESVAVYSVKNNKWLKHPVKENPKFDKKAIIEKHNKWKTKIDALLKTPNESLMRKTLEKLYDFRQMGLDSKMGEYSPENLVFKILRAQGYLQKLKDCATSIYDKEMTITERLNLLESECAAMIDDGISSPDGKQLDWFSDEEEGEYALVPTDDDDQRRMFKVFGIPVFAAYRVMPKGVTAMRTMGDEDAEEMGKNLVNIRTAVKHPDAKGKRTVTKLIDWSIDRLFLEPKIDAKSISVIIPLGSKSKLNNEVARKLKEKLPNAVVLENFLQKDVWRNVQWSKKFLDNMDRRRASGADMTWYDSFMKNIEIKKVNHANEPFAIKNVPSTTRTYFSMFYKTSDNYAVDAMKILAGANVLVIDDTLEAGSTLIEADRALKQYNVKALSAYIFLYGKDVRIPKEVPLSESENNSTVSLVNNLTVYRGARNGNPKEVDGPSYFCSSESFAKTYGTTAAFRLNVKNPLIVTDADWRQYANSAFNPIRDVVKLVRSSGHDSVINIRNLPNGNKFYTALVLDPRNVTLV